MEHAAKFQSSKLSNFQNFELSKFQMFEISRFHYFELQAFELLGDLLVVLAHKFLVAEVLGHQILVCTQSTGCKRSPHRSDR